MIEAELANLIREQGQDLARDTRRTEAFLRDIAPTERRKISVLLAAQREGIVDELIETSDDRVSQVRLAQLATKLHDDTGIEAELSIWAVETWLTALGKSRDERLRKGTVHQDNFPVSAQSVSQQAVPASKDQQNAMQQGQLSPELPADNTSLVDASTVRAHRAYQVTASQAPVETREAAPTAVKSVSCLWKGVWIVLVPLLPIADEFLLLRYRFGLMVVLALIFGLVLSICFKAKKLDGGGTYVTITVLFFISRILQLRLIYLGFYTSMIFDIMLVLICSIMSVRSTRKKQRSNSEAWSISGVLIVIYLILDLRKMLIFSMQ